MACSVLPMFTVCGAGLTVYKPFMNCNCTHDAFEMCCAQAYNRLGDLENCAAVLAQGTSIQLHPAAVRVRRKN